MGKFSVLSVPHPRPVFISILYLLIVHAKNNGPIYCVQHVHPRLVMSIQYYSSLTRMLYYEFLQFILRIIVDRMPVLFRSGQHISVFGENICGSLLYSVLVDIIETTIICLDFVATK
jgi:hypothetical protein